MAGLGRRDIWIVSLSSSSVNSGTFVSPTVSVPLTGGYLTNAGTSFPGSATRYVVGMQGRLDIFRKNAPRRLVTTPVVDFFLASFSPLSIACVVLFLFSFASFEFTFASSLSFASSSSIPTCRPFVFLSLVVEIALQLLVDVGRDCTDSQWPMSISRPATLAEETFRTTLVAGRRDPPLKIFLEKFCCPPTGCRTLFVMTSWGVAAFCRDAGLEASFLYKWSTLFVFRNADVFRFVFTIVPHFGHFVLPLTLVQSFWRIVGSLVLTLLA